MVSISSKICINFVFAACLVSPTRPSDALPGDIQKTEPNLLEVKNKQQHKRIVKLEMDFI